MALDFYRVRESVPCTVSVASGDASPESVQIFGICVRDGQKQESLLKTSVPSLVKAGDSYSFAWDTAGTLRPAERSMEYAIEARGSKLWGRKKVIVFDPVLVVAAVDKENRPIPGAICRVSVRIDPDFLLAGRAFADGYEIDCTDSYVWTMRTDEMGLAVFPDMPVGEVEIQWVKPYLLTGSRWKEEGEYSLTGPKRKAELKRTPVIHYAWWASNPPPPIAAANQVAALETTVYYWTHGPVAGLHPEILARELHSAVEWLADADGISLHPVLMGRAANLERIFQSFAQYNMEVPMQTLARLCILFREGDYSFDARVSIANSGTVQNLPVPMSCKANLPRPAGERKECLFFPNDRSADGTWRTRQVPAGSRDADPPGAVRTFPVDWAAFSAPRRHVAALMMLDALLERAENLGLAADPGVVYLSSAGESVQVLLADDLRREALADALVAASVLEGLWRFAGGDADQIGGHAQECADFGL